MIRVLSVLQSAFISPWMVVSAVTRRTGVAAALATAILVLSCSVSQAAPQERPVFDPREDQVVDATATCKAAPRPTQWTGLDGAPLPFTSVDQVLDFLRTAEIVQKTDLQTGVSRPQKLLLERDGVRAHAIFRTVDVEKTVGPQVHTKAYLGYKDKAIFECAAFRVSQLLGLGWVPPAVQRTILRTKGSLQLWVENTVMAIDLVRQRAKTPDPVYWFRQRQTMDLFDNLIGNPDRNMGNMLLDKDWNLWLVDHTRAFVMSTTPLRLERVTHCDRTLYQRLQKLNAADFTRALHDILSRFEIKCLLDRRQRLLEHIDAMIAARGADDVLFDLP